MKLIDSRLYLEFNDAIACGIKENTLNKASQRKSPSWCFIDDPADKRKVLIDFEMMMPQYKELVKARFGNPYEYLVKEPIRKMVTKDLEAEKFFLSYKYDDNKSLPIETINNYTTVASWLNMLVKAEADKKEIKKLLNISITDFFVKVAEIIESEGVKLPSNIIRLRQRIDAYKTDGYKSIINKSFGNKSAAKVACELTESLLLELIAIPNADDVVTCRRYNMAVAELNKPQISVETVKNWRRKNMHLIAGQKYGTRPAYNILGKHIMRKRPSAPLVLVEHDDNELDLYFQSETNKKGKAQVYYFNRFVIAVVTDAFNDYILGWAIAETYNKELIKFAYLDAVYHIKELTGAWYLPHQIRSDRFGLDINLENDLATFYKSLAIYTPAAVKVARGKYIEQSFGTKWHQALGCYKNYSGHNITAKTKLNQDHREANQKDFPTKEQAPAQIAHFIDVMRKLVDEKTGLSKQEQWVKAFNESELSKKHLINETQLLLKLGTTHTHTNKITNRGITPAINCIERTYEIPEPYYLQTIGKSVNIIFDQMDYSRILVTDGQGLLFIANEIELMPSAIADYKPGDRAKLNDRLEEKIRHMQVISDKKQKRDDVLQLNRINAESYLQAGVHTKALNHQAMLTYEKSYSNDKPVVLDAIEDDKPFDPLDMM